MEKVIPLITITKDEYDYLVERSKWLQCLEDAGVDNWQGMDFAHDLAKEREAKNENSSL